MPQERGVEMDFPDPRVTQLIIEGRPAHVSDLRIDLWVTIHFEIDESDLESATVVSRELLDRVVDAIAVSAGDDVRVVHWSERFKTSKGTIIRLRPTSIVQPQPRPLNPIPLMSAPLTPTHYRALRHLRHGLARVSPERRFSSLMLAVMILARTLPDPEPLTRECPACHKKTPQTPGDRQRVLNLASTLNGWELAEVAKLWNLRNSVMGHGGKDLSPDVAMELLDASFSAARLAYDCLNASLPGVDLEGPAPSWFITDLYLLLDSADHMHETSIDVQLSEDGGLWTASWPAVDPTDFHASDASTALRAAAEYAVQSMKRPPTAGEGNIPDVFRLSVHV